MRFHDTEGVCPVATVGAATVPAMVAICLLSQPYIVVGAVVVIGAVVVAVPIQEELEAHARRRGAYPEETEGSLEAAEAGLRTSSSTREAMAAGKPKPGGQGGDWFPPGPKEPLAPAERRPECVPEGYRPREGIRCTKQVVELQRERELARACGFGFRVGVRDAGHKAALELAAPALEELIAVMDWC
ncbi:hypothetical protein SAMN05444354_103159 [Stigmatella aurantiaca]|uniref:DUF6310 domain-containing protein n=1 Tax=Stigmatella aurantiaca TaxID=41 RepID=A0A1H7LA22_STIAU|nr:DUF6310 domain-containing protein [Stigmatella aurantiaca]SEK95365.1 hypothetical protein SAMN05444354_103159 [Stigmatella aurantiaca]